jgi:arylsulfatase A-like enzyme
MNNIIYKLQKNLLPFFFLLISHFVIANDTIPNRPNIIYILADDMGYSDIGCYGSEIKTPHLDKIAANGIKLRSFYNNARCCPTRASLLTGQFPHTVGMGEMVTQATAPIQTGSYQGFLDPKYPTIAETLKANGYNTYMTGKWHVGERTQHWPLTRGFERYFGLISGASSYYEIIPQEIGKRHIVLDDKDFDIPKDSFYLTDAFTSYAIQYLNDHKKNHSDHPFFLYLAYTAPHFPIHAYEQDIAKYEKLYEQGWDVTRTNRYKKMIQLGLIDKRYQLTERPADIEDWNKVADKKQWVRKMAVYAAMIDRMDQNIGRLIATLKANKQFDNTLIVFMSDNGGCAENVDNRNFNDKNVPIGARGSYVTYDYPWANVSNTPFKKYKKFMHEGGMITPCIIQWPAKIKAQPGFNEGVGHIIDLLPTSLELAGVSMNNLPGQSLSYLWKGNHKHPETYFWEHVGNKAMRKGNWKIVKDIEDADWELYDMTIDLTESNNVAKNHPTLLNEMIAEYDVWAKKNGVQPFVKGKNKAD